MKFIIVYLLTGIKHDLIARYPNYSQQIKQINVPSVGYREHMRFDIKHLRFIIAECNLFGAPQIIITKDKNPAVMAYRLKHELTHYVIAAAGLPIVEHERLDKGY